MHTVEVLLDAVLVLGPVVAQRARVQRRQAALDALVPPARVLGLVGAAAPVAPVHGGAVLIGGAQHVQRIDGGGSDGRSGRGMTVVGGCVRGTGGASEQDERDGRR